MACVLIGAHCRQNLKATYFRHHDIQQDDIWVRAANQVESLGGICSTIESLVPFLLKVPLNHLNIHLLVVDDGDFGRTDQFRILLGPT
jgi:hypothetical protein